MDWIKSLLEGIEEEKQTEIIDAFKKEFPKHAVPKSEFNKINGELKDTKGQLDGLSESLKDLSTKESTIQELQAQLKAKDDEVQTFQAETEKRMTLMEKRSQTKDLISDKFPKSAIDLILDKVDYETVNMAEGKISEADKLVGSLTEQYSDLAIKVESDSHHKDENNNTAEVTADASLRAYMGLPPIITKG